eukprot:TRINITY_DN5195_c0_g1_i2.p1 TRINITY_DN5195_c0_g1~~TRINITY_DN5195_c0_g1_i2.p1  ORF type:complete len:166 (+),score=31.18 TRINITY_DN5195_c0_g1_i2:32-529(+)
MLPGSLLLRSQLVARRSARSVASAKSTTTTRTVQRAVFAQRGQSWTSQTRFYAADAHHSEPNYFPDDVTVAPDGKKIFTRAEVGKHNSEQDAWVVIRDRVFNISTWIPLHPGGRQFLLDHAGRDATASFSEQGHSHVAIDVLAELHIGYIREKGRYSGKSLPELW